MGQIDTIAQNEIDSKKKLHSERRKHLLGGRDKILAIRTLYIYIYIYIYVEGALEDL
jgi:hypothetical protein